MTTAPAGRWYSILDGDPRGYALFKRHYTFRQYRDNRRRLRRYNLFVGPGEKMVLLSQDCKALFAWRKFINDAGEQGVNCAVFHNESDTLSSALILEAEQLAWAKWPGERLYTYVDPDGDGRTRKGKCFVHAGWNWVWETKHKRKRTTQGQLILEKLP